MAGTPGTALADSIEHGFELDAGIAAEMAGRGCVLVSTMTVLKSFQSFGTTTVLPRFADAENRVRIAERLERAKESVRLAHAAGAGQRDLTRR